MVVNLELLRIQNCCCRLNTLQSNESSSDKCSAFVSRRSRHKLIVETLTSKARNRSGIGHLARFQIIKLLKSIVAIEKISIIIDPRDVIA